MSELDCQIQESVSLEKTVLNQIIQAKMPVAIYLVNGISLKGFIVNADNHTILLSASFTKLDNQQLIFKQAITTILPGDHDVDRKINQQRDTNYKEEG